MMLPFKKIICPIDFSEHSYKALEVAQEIARQFSAALYLLNVVSYVPVIPPDVSYGGPYGFDAEAYEESMIAAAEEYLEEIREKRLPGYLEVKTMVLTGDAAKEIVETAENENADLIVIATHGLTGWRHLIFGSVAEKVVQHAPCPVLTIRPLIENEPPSSEESGASHVSYGKEKVCH